MIRDVLFGQVLKFLGAKGALRLKGLLKSHRLLLLLLLPLPPVLLRPLLLLTLLRLLFLLLRTVDDINPALQVP